MAYKFKLKVGLSPKSLPKDLHLCAGDRCILVFDELACVGVVWKHCEKRRAKANGQAEIRFFDEYYNKYKVWHRMFHSDGQRIYYDRLEAELQNYNEYIYYGNIRK